jgi:hypothetical protein
MRNCLRRARPVVARGCATETYAASAKAKAIAYSSTDSRSQSDTKSRRGGNAIAQNSGRITSARPGQDRCLTNKATTERTRPCLQLVARAARRGLQIVMVETDLSTATSVGSRRLVTSGISVDELRLDSALRTERPRSYGGYRPYIFLKARMQRRRGAGQGLRQSGAW